MLRYALPSTAILAVLAGPVWAEDFEADVTGLAFRYDSEYSWNWANSAVKAGDAHLRGWTGAGQTVAVFDTGLNSHSEFNGRVVTGYDAVLNKTGVAKDYGWHGTFVTGAIGAARDGKGMEGIAYDAKLMSVRIANADGSITLSDKNLANGIKYATGKAGVFNNSWNSTATIYDVSKTSFGSYYGQSISAWRNAVANNTIVVWAAGNEGKSQPGMFAALPTWYSDLRKGWVVAVATDKTGVIASYSNRCGAAAAWCLAAPGSNLTSTYGASQYATASGTSFAAPVISGGALLLKQQWPHLANDQITGIMFRTANKSGIYANTATYGQGMLNMEAATRPVGATGIATGTKTSATTSTSNSLLVTSAAFGKSFKVKGAGQTVMILDEYERDYHVPVESFVAPTVTAYDIEKGMARLGSGLVPVAASEKMHLAVANDERATASGLPRHVMQLAMGDGERLTTVTGVSPVHLFGGEAASLDAAGMLAKSEAAGSAYLGLAGNDLMGAAWMAPVGKFNIGVAAFYGRQADAPSEWELAATDPTRSLSTAAVSGVALRASTDIGTTTLNLNSGMIRESGTVLGASADGAFALGDAADTIFVGLSFDAKLPQGISAFGGVEVGQTNAQGADGSLIVGLSNVATTAFHLGVAKEGVAGSEDRVSFVLSQPLRAQSGSMDLNLPVARDLDGTVHYASSQQDVTADGREIDLQLGYSAGLGDGQSITAAGLLRVQPDNIRDAKSETVLMSKYRVNF